MTSNEIRNSFLKFFEERGHKIVPSASVIPYDDPTLLFTNAGMNQFKDVFLGTGKRDYVRAVNSQKCIRVSGKHNDLEEVGRDTYHHTFFEMLGNWSFGDYYKKEAIEWAWELLSKVWGLDKKRLYATVYESDDEAEQLWKTVTDIDSSHVLRFGKKDNFWEMGETGPCGPCSEIHIDLTDDLSGGKLVNTGDARVMEIWNLVFIQYNRDEKGTLTPLPAKHVDTGMGFERICAVLQGKKSNYETDVFMPIIDEIGRLVDHPYQAWVENSSPQVAMRVLSDHLRALTFAISDGALPSNEKRGYVLRKLIRRASIFTRDLSTHGPFIYKLVPRLVDTMGDMYPEIKRNKELVENILFEEEESFENTLDRGMSMVWDHIHRKVVKEQSRIFSGEFAFKLQDTYGFPIDLTQFVAQKQGLQVDMKRFEELMEKQKVRAREAGKIQAVPQILRFLNSDLPNKAIEFVGYEKLETEAQITSVAENYLILDRTPFYAESGGQVGDTGLLVRGNDSINIIDTIKEDNIIAHRYEGSIGEVGSFVQAKVDIQRRLSIMRNHTATHLVHEALRMVLGEHLHQQGSHVAPDRFRFDFNHFEKITPDQIRKIEDIVNEKIAEGLPVTALNDTKEWLTIEEAKRQYPKLKMFFGEKYGEKVRVVAVKDYCAELCGGTHVKNTKDIQLFKIISESSIATGIRRIEAVTGEGLRKYIEAQVRRTHEMDVTIDSLLKEREYLEKQIGRFTIVRRGETPKFDEVIIPDETINIHNINEIESAITKREESKALISDNILSLKKILSKYRVKEVSSGIESLVANAQVVDGIKIVSAKVDVQSVDELQSLGDTLRSKLGSGLGILGTVMNDKVSLVCVVTDDLIKNKKLLAGKIVGEIAKLVSGGGGGRPHLATAGGKDVAKLDEALAKVPEIVRIMITK